MWIGMLFALMAGVMWGLIFVGPVIVPEYPPILQTMGRYVVFGVVAVMLAWPDRARLKKLSLADWKEALLLTLVGNIVYYLCLSTAIQHTGAAISTMIIGTLPVVIPIVANIVYSRYDGYLPWKKLAPPLLCVAVGLVCVNIAELRAMDHTLNMWRYLIGIVLALGALCSWTFYPLRNARWLRQHPEKHPMTWTIAQGVVTLPLAVVGYFFACWFLDWSQPAFILPFGPRPFVFVGLMLAIGILCSWVGTFLWSAASQRVPSVFLGPFIVFEVLFGMLYTFLLRQAYPDALTVFGIVALALGVILSGRMKVEKRS